MTDLDSSASELSGKWKASKSALVLLMRSWVGMVQLTADDMAWPTLVRMLKDPKVRFKPTHDFRKFIKVFYNPPTYVNLFTVRY